MHIAIDKKKFDILNKIHKVASTDDTKPPLTTVKLSLVGDKLTAVATDGYILAEYTTTVKDPDGDFDILISAKQFAKLAKLYHKPLEFFTLEYTDNSITIGGLDGSITAPRCTKPFPDYKPLLPKLDPEQTRILSMCDVTLLSRLMSVLPKNTPIRLTQTEDKFGPISIHTNIDGLTLIIMPLK